MREFGSAAKLAWLALRQAARSAWDDAEGSALWAWLGMMAAAAAAFFLSLRMLPAFVEARLAPAAPELTGEDFKFAAQLGTAALGFAVVALGWPLGAAARFAWNFFRYLADPLAGMRRLMTEEEKTSGILLLWRDL